MSYERETDGLCICVGKEAKSRHVLRSLTLKSPCPYYTVRFVYLMFIYLAFIGICL